MPATLKRPSMQQLSNIWSNPYGGTPTDDLNVQIGEDTDRYHLGQLALERARLENTALEEYTTQQRQQRPEAKRVQMADDTAYSVGMFNSPLGYQRRQMQDVEAADEVRRTEPVHRRALETVDANWAGRKSLTALQNEGRIDVQLLKNLNSTDLATRRAAERLIANMIQAQSRQASAYTNAVGGIHRAGASMTGDVSGAMNSFRNEVPNPVRGVVPWAVVEQYAVDNGISVDEAHMAFINDNFQVQR